VSEIIQRDSGDFKPLCCILDSCGGALDETESLQAALLEALLDCQQQSHQLDRLCRDFKLYYGGGQQQSLGQFPCRIGLLLIPQLNVPAGLAATGTRVAVADAALEAFLHCDMLDLANALVAASGGPGPFGLALPDPCPEGAMDRAVLLLQPVANLRAPRRRRHGRKYCECVHCGRPAGRLCDGFPPHLVRGRLFLLSPRSGHHRQVLPARPQARVPAVQRQHLVPESAAEGPGHRPRLMLCSAVRLSLPDLALPLAKIGTRFGIYRALQPDCLSSACRAIWLAKSPPPCWRLPSAAFAIGGGAATWTTLSAAAASAWCRCRRTAATGICPAGRPAARRRLHAEDATDCLLAVLQRAADIFNSTLMVGPVGLLARRPRFSLQPDGPAISLSGQE
uniref:Reverse transcriptase domain-containing protein n=1 Tax=Macrostomum lignano TaxID=282301 RepID=A0A1I8IJP7_9PLAT